MSKDDLSSIYRLEFYKKQKNWKFRHEVSEAKKSGDINQTYSVEHPKSADRPNDAISESSDLPSYRSPKDLGDNQSPKENLKPQKQTKIRQSTKRVVFQQKNLSKKDSEIQNKDSKVDNKDPIPQKQFNDGNQEFRSFAKDSKNKNLTKKYSRFQNKDFKVENKDSISQKDLDNGTQDLGSTVNESRNKNWRQQRSQFQNKDSKVQNKNPKSQKNFRFSKYRPTSSTKVAAFTQKDPITKNLRFQTQNAEYIPKDLPTLIREASVDTLKDVKSASFDEPKDIKKVSFDEPKDIKKASFDEPKDIKKASFDEPKDIKKASFDDPKDVKKASFDEPKDIKKASFDEPKDIKKASFDEPKDIKKASFDDLKDVKKASFDDPKDVKKASFDEPNIKDISIEKPKDLRTILRGFNFVKEKQNFVNDFYNTNSKEDFETKEKLPSYLPYYTKSENVLAVPEEKQDFVKDAYNSNSKEDLETKEKLPGYLPYYTKSDNVLGVPDENQDFAKDAYNSNSNEYFENKENVPGYKLYRTKSEQVVEIPEEKKILVSERMQRLGRLASYEQKMKELNLPMAPIPEQRTEPAKCQTMVSPPPTMNPSAPQSPTQGPWSYGGQIYPQSPRNSPEPSYWHDFVDFQEIGSIQEENSFEDQIDCIEQGEVWTRVEQIHKAIENEGIRTGWAALTTPLNTESEDLTQFMIGAHCVPHSSEIDIHSSLSQLELEHSTSLHSASSLIVLAHARRAARLLRRALTKASVRDRTQSTQSLEAISPSYEEFPTRDVGLLHSMKNSFTNDVFVAGSYKNDPRNYIGDGGQIIDEYINGPRTYVGDGGQNNDGYMNGPRTYVGDGGQNNDGYMNGPRFNVEDGGPHINGIDHINNPRINAGDGGQNINGIDYMNGPRIKVDGGQHFHGYMNDIRNNVGDGSQYLDGYEGYTNYPNNNEDGGQNFENLDGHRLELNENRNINYLKDLGNFVGNEYEGVDPNFGSNRDIDIKDNTVDTKLCEVIKDSYKNEVHFVSKTLEVPIHVEYNITAKDRILEESPKKLLGENQQFFPPEFSPREYIKENLPQNIEPPGFQSDENSSKIMPFLENFQQKSQKENQCDNINEMNLKDVNSSPRKYGIPKYSPPNNILQIHSRRNIFTSRDELPRGLLPQNQERSQTSYLPQNFCQASPFLPNSPDNHPGQMYQNSTSGQYVVQNSQRAANFKKIPFQSDVHSDFHDPTQFYRVNSSYGLPKNNPPKSQYQAELNPCHRKNPANLQFHGVNPNHALPLGLNPPNTQLHGVNANDGFPSENNATILQIRGLSPSQGLPPGIPHNLQSQYGVNSCLGIRSESNASNLQFQNGVNPSESIPQKQPQDTQFCGVNPSHAFPPVDNPPHYLSMINAAYNPGFTAPNSRSKHVEYERNNWGKTDTIDAKDKVCQENNTYIEFNKQTNYGNNEFNNKRNDNHYFKKQTKNNESSNDDPEYFEAICDTLCKNIDLKRIPGNPDMKPNERIAYFKGRTKEGQAMLRITQEDSGDAHNIAFMQLPDTTPSTDNDFFIDKAVPKTTVSEQLEQSFKAMDSQNLANLIMFSRSNTFVRDNNGNKIYCSNLESRENMNAIDFSRTKSVGNFRNFNEDTHRENVKNKNQNLVLEGYSNQDYINNNINIEKPICPENIQNNFRKPETRVGKENTENEKRNAFKSNTKEGKVNNEYLNICDTKCDLEENNAVGNKLGDSNNVNSRNNMLHDPNITFINVKNRFDVTQTIRPEPKINIHQKSCTNINLMKPEVFTESATVNIDPKQGKNYINQWRIKVNNFQGVKITKDTPNDYRDYYRDFNQNASNANAIQSTADILDQAKSNQNLLLNVVKGEEEIASARLSKITDGFVKNTGVNIIPNEKKQWGIKDSGQANWGTRGSGQNYRKVKNSEQMKVKYGEEQNYRGVNSSEQNYREVKNSGQTNCGAKDTRQIYRDEKTNAQINMGMGVKDGEEQNYIGMKNSGLTNWGAEDSGQIYRGVKNSEQIKIEVKYGEEQISLGVNASEQNFRAVNASEQNCRGVKNSEQVKMGVKYGEVQTNMGMNPGEQNYKGVNSSAQNHMKNACEQKYKRGNAHAQNYMEINRREQNFRGVSSSEQYLPSLGLGGDGNMGRGRGRLTEQKIEGRGRGRVVKRVVMI